MHKLRSSSANFVSTHSVTFEISFQGVNSQCQWGLLVEEEMKTNCVHFIGYSDTISLLDDLKLDTTDG